MKRRTDLDRTVRISLIEAAVFAFCVEGQGSSTEGEWLDACDDMDRIIEQAMPDQVEVLDQAYLVDPRRIEITGFVPPNSGDDPAREPETWTIRIVVIGEEALVMHAKRFYAVASLGGVAVLDNPETERAIDKFLGHKEWYILLDPTEDGYVNVFDDANTTIYQINVLTGTIALLIPQ